MKLSKKKLKEFRADPNVCPVCGSWKALTIIKWRDPLPTDLAPVMVKGECLDCGVKWTELYQLEKVEVDLEGS